MKRGKTRGLARLIRHFGRREEGATAVEFALVAGPFFALLLVIFETAVVLFTDISLQNGVTAASRLIRTGQAQNMSLDSFRSAVCKNVFSYIDCSKIRLDVSKSATQPPAGVDMDTVNDSTPQSWQKSDPSDWVLVQARYDWKLFIPALSRLSNYSNGEGEQMRRLTAGALFRNEPFGG
ncbi:TadE/TadG family type IV pilus assembly protein [Taklimakanibacter lacteus]|uniref:TadE/TadG family type IV pilus assembly protein n=1 Tax=Taklimakanibacter lacteus TaxID=2268456 RepID=UPI000E66BAC1